MNFKKIVSILILLTLSQYSIANPDKLPYESTPEIFFQVEKIFDSNTSAKMTKQLKKIGSKAIPACLYILPKIKIQDKVIIQGLSQFFRTTKHKQFTHWMFFYIHNHENKEVAFEILMQLDFLPAFKVISATGVSKDRKIKKLGKSYLANLLTKNIDKLFFISILYTSKPKTIIEQYNWTKIFSEEEVTGVQETVLQIFGKEKIQETKSLLLDGLEGQPSLRYHFLVALSKLEINRFNIPESILELLDPEESNRLRKQVIRVLGNAKYLPAVPLLLDIFENKEEHRGVIGETYRALKKISGRSFAKDPRRWQMWWQKEGRLIDDNILDFIEQLTDSLPNVREKALLQLVYTQTREYLSTEHRISIIEIFNDLFYEVNEQEQINIIFAIGKLRESTGLSLLEEIIDSENENLREAVVTVLGNFSDKQAIDLLNAALEQEQVLKIQVAIIYALAKQGPYNEEVLYDLLFSDNPKLREATAKSLSGIPDKKHVPLLIELLKDNDQTVKDAVHYSLTMITKKVFPCEYDAWYDYWNDNETNN